MSRSVAIVIPARNEGDNVRSTVRSIIDNTKGVSQIIVVDDGSTDGCCEGLPKHVEVLTCLGGKPLGVGGARMKGFQYCTAKTDYVAFLDAHMTVETGWLQEIKAALDSGSRLAAACPAVHNIKDRNTWGCGVTLTKWRPPVEWKWENPTTTGLIGMMPGMCQVWRVSAFKAIGGFPAVFYPLGMEDIEIGVRTWLMGHDMVAVPSAHVAHLTKDSINPNLYETVLTNALRLSTLHLTLKQRLHVYQQIAGWTGWPEEYLERIWEGAHNGATMKLREKYNRMKKRTIHQWFDQFDPENELAKV